MKPGNLITDRFDLQETQMQMMIILSMDLHEHQPSGNFRFSITTGSRNNIVFGYI